jgi:glycosyltransferase involved in cell wall biosynthesis
MNVLPEEVTTLRQRRAPLRVAMLGMRGFPNVQGGVENHVENLCGRLAEMGCEVEAIVRSPYVPKGSVPPAHVKFVRIWSPRITGVEAFLHTFFGVLRAAWDRPDILHLHAIGPGLFAPLARLLGLRVVVTHHVLNYENEKWGPIGRGILRLGEWAGMVCSNARIAVSTSLGERMKRAYGVSITVIPNGISEPLPTQSTAALQAFGLTPERYILTVARIDPQKRQLDLIAAFARARMPGWKLALAGGADYSSSYSRAVVQAVEETPGVVMLGHQSGTVLAELYTHAGLFALPSGHEGQPIAALEAISYRCPLVLSDIPAHREITTSASRYFPVGDIAALADHLGALMRAPKVERLLAAECERMTKAHDWSQIAEQTLGVYVDALANAKQTDYRTPRNA